MRKDSQQQKKQTNLVGIIKKQYTFLKTEEKLTG